MIKKLVTLITALLAAATTIPTEAQIFDNTSYISHITDFSVTPQFEYYAQESGYLHYAGFTDNGGLEFGALQMIPQPGRNDFWIFTEPTVLTPGDHYMTISLQYVADKPQDSKVYTLDHAVLSISSAQLSSDGTIAQFSSQYSGTDQFGGLHGGAIQLQAIPTTAVPEPTSVGAVVGVGLISYAGFRSHQKKKALKAQSAS